MEASLLKSKDDSGKSLAKKTLVVKGIQVCRIILASTSCAAPPASATPPDETVRETPKQQALIEHVQG